MQDQMLGQEIVIFRDGIMTHMIRNLVGVKPRASNNGLKKYSSSKNCLDVLYFFTVCYITLENKIDKIMKILCNILLHTIYNIST